MLRLRSKTYREGLVCGIAPALWRVIAVIGKVAQVVLADIVDNLRMRSDCRQVSAGAKGCWGDASSHNVVNRWSGRNLSVSKCCVESSMIEVYS